MAPQMHFAEDAADRVRLVATARVRQGVDGISCGVEAAVALGAGHGMHADKWSERILVATALGHERAAVRPHEVVKDGAETNARRRLRHDPGAPTRHRPAGLANGASGFHQCALARRLSAGWMTSSTSPYATASSGAMKRSRSMSFITFSSG
jgi:hypothetical protein